jgi:Putative DNA-binding domain
MPTLRELQAGVAAALLLDDTVAEAWIDTSGLPPATRLDVHRNTVLVSLTDALAATFPVVQRLVDPRFFAYAATVFVRARPPHRPSLAEYGADFADFLANFGPCRELAYLPGVARLEWTVGRVARAVARPPLAPRALGRFSDDETERLTFAFQPTIAVFASRFPVDAIWRANQPEAAQEGIDLAAGPVHLEIRKSGGGITLARFDPAVFAFRAALAAGDTLRAATDAAFAVDTGFDLGRVLAELFQDGAVIAAQPATAKETLP